MVSLGHVYTRLELSWNGSPIHNHDNNQNNNHSAFKIMAGITLFYMMIKQVINFMNLSYHTLYICNLIYMIVIGVLVGKTRRYIREKYEIPATFTLLSRSSSTFASIFGYRNTNHRNNCYDIDDNIVVDEDDEENGILASCCGEIEDYCLGTFFYPCVLSQMNRHTAMYDTYEASCFNSNGLPKHAPTVI